MQMLVTDGAPRGLTRACSSCRAEVGTEADRCKRCWLGDCLATGHTGSPVILTGFLGHL